MRGKTQGSTFSYHDLIIAVEPDVYNPAEDTYLLLEQVHPRQGESVLELGTGCGIIALACAKAGAFVVASDVNPNAVHNLKLNQERNLTRLQHPIDIREGDLFSVVQPSERFDVILFNPPYVPTPPGESLGHWFDLATSGGPDGLQVTARFLRDVGRYLAPRGRAYTIISSRSPSQKVTTLFTEGRLAATVCGRLRFSDEEILCYCLTSAD